MPHTSMPTTKTCACCKQTKPLNEKEFKYKNKRGKRTATYCRSCFNKYKRSGRRVKGLYTRDPVTGKTNLTETHKLAVKRAGWKRGKLKARERCRAYLWSVLCSSSCIDCGIADPLVLEFDHRDPNMKKKDISRMWPRGALTQLREELQKCDVVCRNCHSKRTQHMFGSWRISRQQLQKPEHV